MQALVIARMSGTVTEARARLGEFSPDFSRATPLVKVQVGGGDEVFRQASEQSRKDFLRAEMIVFPLVLLLLFVIYRRFSAALLTLGMGLFSVITTLALLRIVTYFTDVSTFAANLALVMGVGLGVDYSLFVINRFREELRAGRSTAEAVELSVASAGRTVAFSGLTVMVSLACLLLFPFPFLRLLRLLRCRDRPDVGLRRARHPADGAGPPGSPGRPQGRRHPPRQRLVAQHGTADDAPPAAVGHPGAGRAAGPRRADDEPDVRRAGRAGAARECLQPGRPAGHPRQLRRGGDGRPPGAASRPAPAPRPTRPRSTPRPPRCRGSPTSSRSTRSPARTPRAGRSPPRTPRPAGSGSRGETMLGIGVWVLMPAGSGLLHVYLWRRLVRDATRPATLGRRLGSRNRRNPG